MVPPHWKLARAQLDLDSIASATANDVELYTLKLEAISVNPVSVKFPRFLSFLTRNQLSRIIWSSFFFLDKSLSVCLSLSLSWKEYETNWKETDWLYHVDWANGKPRGSPCGLMVPTSYQILFPCEQKSLFWALLP
jgi:hypothetical protein